jgi:voltage-gated potassium channel
VDQVIVDEDRPSWRVSRGAASGAARVGGRRGVLETAGIARRVQSSRRRVVRRSTSSSRWPREANPTIKIHARAETEAGARRLRRAGATQVVSPYQLGGQRLAHAILRPAVADFMELAAPGTGAEIDLEEVVVPSASSLIGTTLGALGERGVQVSVVAIKREADALALNPTAAMELRAGDRVVVVGDRENVTRLAELVARPR